MRTGLKILAVVVMMFLISQAITLVLRGPAEPPTREKSIFQYSKEEYIGLAASNCVKDGMEAEYCRCFYTAMLETMTVREVLAWDAKALVDPDGFELTDEQLRMAARCL